MSITFMNIHASTHKYASVWSNLYLFICLIVHESTGTHIYGHQPCSYTILFHQQQNVDLTLPQLANDLETIKIVMRRIETKQSIEVNNLIQLKGA